MRTPRTHSLDNLRTFLTALVILHHASIPYGGLGSWPYIPSPSSPSAEPGLSSLALVLFNIVNQTFFMALFFLISGYFSARAAEKRSSAAFFKEKGKRLAVPGVVYSVLGPGVVEGIIALLRDGAPVHDAWNRSVGKVVSVRGARGPVWYCGVLLVFDGVFALALYPRASRTADVKEAGDKNAAKQDKRKPHISHLRDAHIFLCLAGAALASFLLRLRWPIGTTFTPLGLEVGFLPQYIVYYATGIYAHCSLGTELHRLVPRTSVRIPRALSAIRTIQGILVLTVNTGVFLLLFTPTPEAHLRGGFNVLAACYAVFNETLGFLLSVLVLRVFGEQDWARRKWSVKGGSLGEVELARWSYAAFLVHAPVVVGLQCGLDGWGVDGVVKSLVVGVLGCAGSWVSGIGLGSGLERIGVKGYV
ncbi:uncharacterized protein CC84DRAFT_1244953 [Paraphaeosphaeria sporulosa]|uniref:Acyltransferase 3 domain-containing protein n=1 Tax=Paraphaeosphaeria sporulosa TaxID=1460663 RepID=A0A177CGZ2_9PLEO|nr:uncharacterized protein CC84DRAFT_1244953 [Paraphaeosphaeria sporulosa]OAG06050.1 hypothetical protein CC84DRAFT_1244953 [Paraphaeosphaeria sporulosa]